MLSGCASHTPLSKTNLEYQLDTRIPIQAQSRCWIEGDSTYIISKIKLADLGAEVADNSLRDRFRLSWALYPSYDEAEPLAQDSVYGFQVYRYDDGDFGLKVSLPKTLQASTQVWVLTLQEKSTSLQYQHDLLVDLQSYDAAYHLALKRPQDALPLPSNHYSTTDTLELLGPTNTQLYIKYLADPFPAALPAMAISGSAKGPGITSLNPVSRTQRITFSNPGLYQYVSDTNNKRTPGLSFVVRPPLFPKVAKTQDLINPLIYITTRDEKKRLADSDAPKLTLDQFWINIGSNPDNARRIIREYYQQVEGANQLFTNYKEGWKTDKGIIYIVFGKPDKVYKSDLIETWVYTSASAQQQYKFDFTRKPTIFTPDNWELNRFSEYADFWYSTVDSWRRGILRN